MNLVNASSGSDETRTVDLTSITDSSNASEIVQPLGENLTRICNFLSSVYKFGTCMQCTHFYLIIFQTIVSFVTDKMIYVNALENQQ